MALRTSTYSTRSLSLLLFAALGGLALWLFAPIGFDGGSGGGESAPSQNPALIQVDRPVAVEQQGDDVISLSIPISVRGEHAIDLSGATLRAETALAETALAAVPARYDIEWTLGNGDMILDPGEQAILRVDLPASSSVRTTNPLDLVFVSRGGPTVIIDDVLAR